METVTGTEIRDFMVRGNYFNQRTLLSRMDLHSSKKDNIVSNSPGYSPPVVEFELQDGTSDSIVISEADVPFLCGDDMEQGKRHLTLILTARRGDTQAAKILSSVAQVVSLGGARRVQPSENEFVVPCTSSQPHSERDMSQKGFILLKLSRLGYPVPDFVVLTAHAYTNRAQQFEEHLADAIRQLEILTMQGLGNCRNPLVFAIRCATTHYIPGVMDTYLNVGVTESTLPCLEKMYGSVAAHKMFLNNLRNLCRFLHRDEHAAIVSAVKSDLAPEEVMGLTERLSEIIRQTDKSLVDDPFVQAAFFAKQAYKDFEENRALVLSLCRGTEHYPSLILQKMICTVRHENSYAGVVYSRHTKTGLGIELQTAHNIFGEEIMTGTAEIQSTTFEDREAIKDVFPAVYHFVPHLGDLEREFESPVTIEFAVEATRRYQWFALLQLNETGMAGRAALTSAMDLHKSGTISRERVTELIRPYHIKQLTSDTIDEEVFRALTSFCSGVSVLPRSAVSARVYFTGEAALKAKREGDKVCLCKKTFVPTDTVVMREVDAILSLTSAAIHVVTICQSMGIPALLNLEKSGVSWEPGGSLVNSSGREIKEGDWITLSSRRRTIYEGKAKFKPARLLRYMKGEPVEMNEDDRKTFASIAYSYRYYQQLIKGLTVEQVSTLNEVVRLVNFEMRGESEEAKQLVNSWFDDREQLYIEEVLKSDIGDHLGQGNVFEKLTLDRKIRFFKGALAKCTRERVSGYEAGAFMLGRFLSFRYPVAFWKSFSPSEIGLLVNEWVLFEKYMQLLHKVGERKVILARKQILKDGLDQLSIQPSNVQCFITLKLSGTRLEEARGSLPDWIDRQAVRVLELLEQPYSAFYNFNAVWSVRQLEKICREENLPLPRPDDV
jgi:Pyruvate phosphate dikinase, AMP/ATP-binding domain